MCISRIEDTGDLHQIFPFLDENTESMKLFLYNKYGGFEIMSWSFMVKASDYASYTWQWNGPGINS